MPSTPNEDMEKPDCVVGIGASAGGLSAFKELLPHLPVGAGFSYILVQHMDPDYPSTLNQILSRFSALSIEMPTHDTLLRRDHLYLTPSNKDCTVAGNELRFTDINHTGPRHSVDALFASLAQTLGHSAVGIVLSGNGSDGCQGAHMIKAAQGLVLVQDPTEAQYPGMPSAVFEARLADIVAPVARLGQELSHLTAWVSGNEEIVPQMSDNPDVFDTLLQLLRRKSGFAFEQYKESTLRRRMERRMVANKIEKLEDYIQLVENSSAEVDIFLKEIQISVTGFFRDESAFEALRNAIKQIVSRKVRNDSLRIWVAGCATGEEAFSIAALVAEALGSRLNEVKVQIFATDVDHDAITHARKSVYLNNLTNSIPEKLKQEYFERLDGTYRVRSIIRDMVVFAEHDVLQEPPFSRLDLVSCRNVLIYFTKQTQERLLAMFHYSLNPNGFLLLGYSEGLGQQGELFASVDADAKLYIRKAVKVQPPLVASRKQKRTIRVTETEVADFCPPEKRVRLAVFNQYSPPGVLVNESYEAVYIHGEVSHFLTLPQGLVDMNLLDMVVDPLRLELRLTLQKSRRENQLVRSNPIDFHSSNGNFQVTLVAMPAGMGNEPGDGGLAETVVLFETSPYTDKTVETGQQISEATDLRIRELEQELAATREHLQTNIEELEVANEELQAVNEELQSTTEEFQSTNEEFQSTNEELQSTNEELQTVNDELSLKSKELACTNTDLENILNTVTNAIIVLDQDTRVTRYSAGASLIADLLPTSIGRPVATVGGAIDLTVLSTEIKAVIKTGNKLERELELGNRIFLVRIQPVDVSDQGGLIISFSEETERLEAARLTRRLASVVRDSYDAIIVQDTNGQILEWNRGATRMYGYEEAEARKMNILELIPEAAQQQTLDSSKRLLRSLPVKPYESIRLTKDGLALDVWITSSAMHDEEGGVYAISTTERDLAERKLADAVRKDLAEAEVKEAMSRMAKLTAREREILVLLVEGSANASSRQIAEKLGISPRTVDTHRRRIKQKMHAFSQADLHHIAKLCGVLDPDAA